MPCQRQPRQAVDDQAGDQVGQAVQHSARDDDIVPIGAGAADDGINGAEDRAARQSVGDEGG